MRTPALALPLALCPPPARWACWLLVLRAWA